MSSKAKNIQSGFPQNQLNPFTFCTFFCAHGRKWEKKGTKLVGESQRKNIPHACETTNKERSHQSLRCNSLDKELWRRFFQEYIC